MYNLFLDDIRDPDWVTRYKTDPSYNTLKWVVVRSYDEFVDYISNNGLPSLISFDHDLADIHYTRGFKMNDDYYDKVESERTGYCALKWLCNYILDNDLKIPNIKFHTANYVGLKNMSTYLHNFIKHNPDLVNN